MTAGVDGRRAALRRRIEAIMALPAAQTSTVATAEVQALLRDLRAHDMELELQNEYLRGAQAEVARDSGGEVVVEVRRDGNGVRVTVRDDGPGVAADAAGRLFDALSSTKAEGLGVGLGISRGLVEAYGGRLWVEPATPGGVFHFTLPVVEAGS